MTRSTSAALATSALLAHLNICFVDTGQSLKLSAKDDGSFSVYNSRRQ